MNIQDFSNRIMKPAPVPPEEPVVEETQVDPMNTALEGLILNQDEKLTETNQLLEHLLVKVDENSDRSIDEFQLQKTAEVVDELKRLNDNMQTLDATLTFI